MSSGSAIKITIAGLVAAAVVAISEPAVAQVDTSQAQPKIVAKTGTYPNFTNWGVFGNPAIASSSQFGNWFSIDGGRSAKGDRIAGFSLMKDVETASLTFSASTSTSSRGTSLSQGITGSIPLGNGVLVGGNVTRTASPEGKSNSSSGVGIVGIHSGDGYVVRVGIAREVVADVMSYAAELRTDGKVEFTLSGKISERDGEVIDKGVGFQVKKGKVLLSFGRGGNDWREMKAHARLFLGKTKLDLHFQGTCNRILRKPGAKLVVIRNF
jgi:hypothetical protein